MNIIYTCGGWAFRRRIVEIEKGIIVSAKLPYLASPGTAKTVLDKVIEARIPDRFTQDFLETKLGAKGGSARAVIPLLKRIGLIQQDGSPTELYRKFRNNDTMGRAMAEAIRYGYKELFDRNEYAHELSKAKLLDLIGEVSGKEKGNSADNYTAQTFLNLSEYADFDADASEDDSQIDRGQVPASNETVGSGSSFAQPETASPDQPITLAYSINLHLPETDDIKVFDAIFQSLNANILKR